MSSVKRVSQTRLYREAQRGELAVRSIPKREISPGSVVFSISHLREAIFDFHYQVRLNSIPFGPQRLPIERLTFA